MEMVGGVAVAVEATVEALCLPCLARHWSKGHDKTLKAIPSPLALGKDEDMLWTSREKMATYIGTKFGDDAAQEWTSKKQITLKESAYSKSILDRHGGRVKATKDQITLKLTSLRSERTVLIEDEIKASPTDCKLIMEKQDIKD